MAADNAIAAMIAAHLWRIESLMAKLLVETIKEADAPPSDERRPGETHYLLEWSLLEAGKTGPATVSRPRVSMKGSTSPLRIVRL